MLIVHCHLVPKVRKCGAGPLLFLPFWRNRGNVKALSLKRVAFYEFRPPLVTRYSAGHYLPNTNQCTAQGVDQYSKLPEGSFLFSLALYSLLSFHVLKPIKTKRKCGLWGGGGRWLSVPGLSSLPLMMFLLSTNQEDFVYTQDISSLL
jgi:hypothetical protein